MAASIKISELNSLTDLTDVDLFLVSDMETGTSRKISYTNLKSNVTADTTSALSDLQNVVSQNRQDAETLVETVRLALVASLSNETSSRSNVDNNIQADLSAYKAHMDDINLQLALAYDVPTYIDTLQGG